MAKKLSGFVVDGKGGASGFMQEGLESIREATGMAIVPGTLNMRLRQPIRISGVVRLPVALWHDEMYLCPARLLDLRVYLLFDSGNQKVGQDIVDIMSDVWLRREKGLRTGMPIELEIDSDYVQPLPWIDRLRFDARRLRSKLRNTLR